MTELSDASPGPPAGAVSMVPVTGRDPAALRAALYEAVCWRETGPRPRIDEVLSDPKVALYVDGWGRAGDIAVVAVDQRGERGGAAWCRHYTVDRHGHGFVSPQIPELAIGLRASWRGRGIGSRLLAAAHAQAVAAGVEQLSLSVELANRVAIRLYLRSGYALRRVEWGAQTMVVDLRPAGRAARSAVPPF